MKFKHYIFILLIFHSCIEKENPVENKNSLVNEINNFNKGNIDSKKRKKSIELIYNNINYLKNSKQTRDVLSKILYEYYINNDDEKLKIVNNKLLQFSKVSKDSLNLGVAYRYKSSYFQKLNILDSSLIYIQKAEKIYLNIKSESLTLATVFLNKGTVQYFAGDYIASELSLTRATNRFKDSDQYYKLYITYNQLGLVYNELKEYEKAIFYHNKALEIIDKFNLDNNFEKTISYNNIGYLYSKQNKYNEAIVYFEKGLENKNIIKKDPDLYSLLIDNLALSRLRINNYKDLPNLFFEALSIREKLNTPSTIVDSHIHLSEYFQSIKNHEEAKKHVIKAIEIARNSKIPINLIQALKQASIVDERNASLYSKEYIRISDSLQIAERKSKDRFARIQLETDEIIQEKDNLEDKNRNLLYFLFGSLGLFMFLYYLRTQRAKNRELLYKQAQQKANEDIFNLMMSQQAIIDESRTEEKQKLARELHDGVLGRMFGLRLSLDSVNRKNDEEALLKRNQIIEELKTIEQDIREISHDLNREKQVLINNFVSIVNNLIEEQKEKHDVNVSFFLDNAIIWDKIASAVKINLYRILQESLQNINKYAKAKNINVGFVKNNDTIIFKISDDGIGFDANKKSKGIGTQNMVARTKECNGTIDILSEIGQGTTITITIPTT